MLNALLPIVLAAIIVPLFQVLQNGIKILDTLPAWIKQIIVGAASYGLVLAAGKAGVQLSSQSILGLDQQTVSALLTFGLTQLFHSKAQPT